MKKENKLLIKIKLLLKSIGAPRWLHHFGPKKYQLKHHLFALVMMEAFQLSLRRVEKMLEMLGIKVPTFSALCKRRKKIPKMIWNKMIQLTAGATHSCVAIDSTGLSRTSPSYHYIKRIDSKYPINNYSKMSILFDVDKNKIISFHSRVKPAHDIRDVKHLVKGKSMKVFLADKAYDAEWLHEMFFWKGIQTQIPSKKCTRRGFFRAKQKQGFCKSVYHRRSLIEAAFSAMKRKYGSSVSGKSVASIRTEASCKAIAYNLRLTP